MSLAYTSKFLHSFLLLIINDPIVTRIVRVVWFIVIQHIIRPYDTPTNRTIYRSISAAASLWWFCCRRYRKLLKEIIWRFWNLRCSFSSSWPTSDFYSTLLVTFDTTKTAYIFQAVLHNMRSYMLSHLLSANKFIAQFAFRRILFRFFNMSCFC